MDRPGLPEEDGLVSQTPEDRMYLMFKALKRNREFQWGHYRKGWYASPYMLIAQRFKVPVRHVKDVIASKRGGIK